MAKIGVGECLPLICSTDAGLCKPCHLFAAIRCRHLQRSFTVGLSRQVDHNSSQIITCVSADVKAVESLTRITVSKMDACGTANRYGCKRKSENCRRRIFNVKSVPLSGNQI